MATPVERWGHATRVDGYDPEADPRLTAPAVITTATGRRAPMRTPDRMRVGDGLALFVVHHEFDRKDGPCAILGDHPRGRRKGTKVRRLFFAGLDVDSGVTRDEVCRRVTDAGLMGVVTSTYSHEKTETGLPAQKAAKWASRHGLGDASPEDQALAWLRTQYEPAVCDGARAELVWGPQAREWVFTHPPVPKWRLIFPMAEPFGVAEQGGYLRAKATWEHTCTALAARLGVPIDRSCVDLGRLFYLPARAPGRHFESFVFGGALLDWRALLADAPEAVRVPKRTASGGGPAWAPREGGGKSITPLGQKLGRWAAKNARAFEICEAIREYSPEFIRADHGDRLEIECPFDEGHSNPGDPDDRGCCAWNASDTNVEIFTIKCRHDSCVDYTMLDMLGKILHDQVLPASVLTDEAYLLEIVEN